MLKQMMILNIIRTLTSVEFKGKIFTEIEYLANLEKKVS